MAKSKKEAMSEAANRLHHLSMRYSGAFVELLHGGRVFGLPQGHPGLRETRDFIDLILLTRAEINGLTKLLFDAGLFTEEQFVERMAEEYDYLAKVKASFLGCAVTDEGLSFSSEKEH